MRSTFTSNKQREKPRKSWSSILGAQFRGLDQFGQSQPFQIELGTNQMLSSMGALLTTLLYLITAVFLYSKAMVLLNETDI